MLLAHRDPMQRFALLVVLAFAVVHSASLHAWAQGSPPLTRFEPDLDIHTQNFAIAEDRQGIVYVGNFDGLLEFDGSHWQLHPLPNGELVRSLEIDAEDRVLVGGYNQFGWMLRDANGQLQFHDLTARFADVLDGREFADIWDIRLAPEGVYFRALRDVFLWNPTNDRVSHWFHPGRFGDLRHHAGRSVLQFRGEGLRRYVDGEWEVMPGTAALDLLIHQWVPFPDCRLLGLSAQGDWWWLSAEGQATPAKMPAALPASHQFSTGLILSDGSLALASNMGHMWIVDAQLENAQAVRVDEGYLSALASSRFGGVLVSANRAIYRLGWPSSWSVLGIEHRAEGTFSALLPDAQDLLLASSAGVVRFMDDPVNGQRAVQTDWVHDDAMALLGLEAERYLVATSRQILAVENGTSRIAVSADVYPRLFAHSRLVAGRVLVGTEHGLRVLDTSSLPWRINAVDPAADGHRVNSLVELDAQRVLVGMDRHGVAVLALTPEGEPAQMTRIPLDRQSEHGPRDEAFVTRLSNGEILISRRSGLYRFDPDGGTATPHALQGLDQRRRPDELLRIVESTRGTLYAFSRSRVLRHDNDSGWLEEPVAHLRRGAIESAVALPDDGVALLSTNSVLLRRSDAAALSPTEAPRVLLRQVRRSLDVDRFLPLSLRDAHVHAFAQGNFALNFQITLPDLSSVSAPSYRVRLLGHDGEFMPASPARSYTYTRLAAGDYQFEVEATDSQGRTSTLMPWRFTITPPWYARPWAVVLESFAALIGLGLLIRWLVRRRTGRLSRERQRLQDEVALRTQELAAANRQLEMIANADGLTGIPNRRRLDDYLAAVWQQGMERGRALSVLIIDVDHFKHYNDSKGHPAGDALLQALARLLTSGLRRSEDLLARYGGEEFLVVMPGAKREVATQTAEQLRALVAESSLGVTVSIGVARCTPQPDCRLADLIQAADVALYAAKRGGRNRVETSLDRQTE
ncbi:MAG: diguanylate cyclase [Xanthomonadales bacterium]|nr:diguanylate cyclase [Xanthomonadales bacterium]